MKRKLLFGSVLLTLSTLFVGCDKKVDKTTEEVESFKTMYDFAAIGSIHLLNNNVSTDELPTQTEEDEVLNNLKQIEGLLQEGMTKSADEKSDLEGYEKMYKVCTLDFVDGHSEYTFYFNEKVLEQEHDETELALDGIVKINDQTFEMIGKKEVEGKEVEMNFKVMLDQNNYVFVEQEVENDESEFSFTKYENGIKVFETSLEFGRDLLDREFEITQLDKETNQLVSYKYEYDSRALEKYVKVTKIVGDDKDVMRIKFEIDEDGNINYIFD